MNKNIILNSSLEVSLRILILLRNFSDEQLDIDDILLLDYYILHLNDFDIKLNSIHPSMPNRENEIFVRRESIQQGILLLESRDLIDTNFTPQGITYSSNKFTLLFTDYLESSYASRLKRNIETSIDKNKREIISKVKETLFNNINLWSTNYDTFYTKED
ncbi:hypothetical protein P3888_001620 [Listeria monocytogenes]|nr:hypothetical protein [Listeria monocytogenes]